MEVALGPFRLHSNRKTSVEDQIDFTKPATTGMDYLRMVQREAALCPDVVVADELLTRFPPNDETKLIKSVLTSAPMEFIPGFDLQCQQASTFAELRQQLYHFKSEDRHMTMDSNLKLPNMNDEDKWCSFCLGGEKQKEIKKLRAQLKEKNDNNEKKGATEGHKPLLSIVTKMGQCMLIKILEYHISWLQIIGFSELQGEWIYALLACLEKPLLPNVSSLLRTLARNCADLRAVLTDCNDDRLAALNLIITLVTRYFDQTDLAEG